MSDFPSWAEHEAQATRTAAWQIAGFLENVRTSRVTAPRADQPRRPGRSTSDGRGRGDGHHNSPESAADRQGSLSDLAARGADVPVTPPSSGATAER